MMKAFVTTLMLVTATMMSAYAADPPPQSKLTPARAEAAKKYPRIVLFSVAWCPHCRETKEYLTRNEIPFINRDVEVDATAMEELTGKYNSTGVPVLVFGSGKDELVMKGFTPELFQDFLKKARAVK